MKTLKKLLIIPLTLWMLSGCDSYYNPYPRELKKIENLFYEKGVFDCRHKTILDRDFLKSKGVESKIVFGEIADEKNHVWEEIYNPKTGNWYARDPTARQGKDGLEINQYFMTKKKWFEFKQEVTIEDIEKFNKIEKIYWGNIPEKYQSFFKKKIKEKYSTQQPSTL